MREIKCRAWSKKENKWFDGYDNILHLFAQDTGGHGKTETEDYIYSFSTGLKDKNGKEIYESDLLSNDAGAPVMEVVWNKGSWTLNGLENLLSEKIDHTKFLEVIGNKYEGERR